MRKDGSAPVSILWHKDGVALEPNDRITVTMVSMSSSTLAITRIELGDVGNYTCTATSVQGSSEVTVPLIVKGKSAIESTSIMRIQIEREPYYGVTTNVLTNILNAPTSGAFFFLLCMIFNICTVAVAVWVSDSGNVK